MKAPNPLDKYENSQVDSFKAYYKTNPSYVLDEINLFNKLHPKTSCDLYLPNALV